MKNNNTSHFKAGRLIKCASFISLMTLSAVASSATSVTVTRGNPVAEETNAAQVIFTVTFSEAVTGLDKSDFGLTNNYGTAAIEDVTTSGTLTVSGGAQIFNVRVTTQDIAETKISLLFQTAARIIKSDGISDLLTHGNIPFYAVDRLAPTAPTISEPLYSLGKTPLIKGTAEANSVVTVINSVGGQTCTVTANAAGSWECRLSPDLPLGAVTLTATAKDKVGNVSPQRIHKINVLDPAGDDDNDGISNADEVNTVGSNPLSADSDGDGVPDKTELALGLSPIKTDSDGDGVNDGAEDSDSDNIPNSVEVTLGLNPKSNDSDGDGTLDGEEDNDKDGLTNQTEIKLGLNPASADSDGDGIKDFDEDNDGDGLSNGVEIANGLNANNADSDGDGNRDDVDNDWDNDGILNSAEIPGDILLDADNDKVPVYLDDDDQDPTVLDTDGKVHYHYDHDRDGILNHLDLDDDGDGISTKTETGTADSDADGIPDYLEKNNVDSDGDGVKDYLDSDDDGDKIPTISEIGSGGYLKLNDVDKDGIPDYLDGDQLNVAGTTDGSGDSDRNGISDKQECNTGIVCPDLDLDGIADYLDLDDDGDGIADVDEIGANPVSPTDTDKNGIPDYREQNASANPAAASNTGVDTVLNGGGGSSSPFWLLLISPLIWLRGKIATISKTQEKC